jgi:hypothetical protein
MVNSEVKTGFQCDCRFLFHLHVYVASCKNLNCKAATGNNYI